MRCTLLLILGVAALCRADLITFPSLPTAEYAATAPVPTPPGEVFFPGSEWVTPIAQGPQIYEQDFFIPLDIDVVGASIGIKTNGPWAASINGIQLQNVTNSTILDIFPFIHPGRNVFETGGVSGLKLDIEEFVWYIPAPCDPTPTGEPPTIALALPLLAGVFLLRKKAVG